MRLLTFGLARLFCVAAFLIALGNPRGWAAEEMITREYWLKNVNAESMIRALNIVVKNPTSKRIMGGQGKHLVVTDFAEQQTRIAELLPIMDQPVKSTNPDVAAMQIVGNAGMYFHERAKAARLSGKALQGSYAAAPSASGPYTGVKSYDTVKSSWSVYAAEDAKIVKQPRRILDEPTLPPLTDLVLKGIFQSSSGSPIAIMQYGTTIYTARDGGLFEGNSARVKGVSSEILKEKVVLTGPDRVPREIKFKSTL